MSHGSCHSVPFINATEWLCDLGYDDTDENKENNTEITNIPCYIDMSYPEELRKLIEYYNANEKLQLGYKTSVDVWFAVKDLDKRMEHALNNITTSLTAIHSEIGDIKLALTNTIQTGLADLLENLSELNSAEFDFNNFLTANSDVIKLARYVVGRFLEYTKARSKVEKDFKMNLLYNHFKSTMERDYFVRTLRNVLQTKYPDIYKKHWLVRHSPNIKKRNTLACSRQYHAAIDAFQKDMIMMQATVTKAMAVLEYWLQEQGEQTGQERQLRLDVVNQDAALESHWKKTSCPQIVSSELQRFTFSQEFCSETQSFSGMALKIQCDKDAISKFGDNAIICQTSG